MMMPFYTYGIYLGLNGGLLLRLNECCQRFGTLTLNLPPLCNQTETALSRKAIQICTVQHWEEALGIETSVVCILIRK